MSKSVEFTELFSTLEGGIKVLTSEVGEEFDEIREVSGLVLLGNRVSPVGSAKSGIEINLSIGCFELIWQNFCCIFANLSENAFNSDFLFFFSGRRRRDFTVFR